MYINMFTKMRSSEAKIKGIHSRNLSKSDKEISPVFNKINSDEVLEILNQKHSFEYIKDIDKCDYSDIKKLSKNIFDWSKTEFLVRRSLENCVWVDVMMKHTRKDCLESFKIQTDLKEIKSLLKLIFKGLQRSKEHVHLESLVYKPLSEAERYLNIFELLIDERKMLIELLQDYEFRFNTRLFTKRQTKQQLILWGIEETLVNAQTWDPIQMRFQINWYQCKTDQVEQRNTSMENDVQREIAEYKFKMLTEEMSGDNIRDTYYTLAEQYKHDIDVLQSCFDFEIEEIENKINYTRLQISKLIEQRKLLSDQIKKFHEDIKKRIEMEEKERLQQELERLRLEEEATLIRLKNAKNKNEPKSIFHIKNKKSSNNEME